MTKTTDITIQGLLRLTNKIEQHIPVGLEREEYLPLALACLDQADVSVHLQSKIAKMLGMDI